MLYSLRSLLICSQLKGCTPFLVSERNKDVTRSTSSNWRSRVVSWMLVLTLSAAITLAASAFGLTLAPNSGTPRAFAATSLPCNIYATYSTPCVAAHSTTRALYASYSGALYQVKRWSDSTTKDIYVLAAGGYANAASQDTFCSGTTCTITKIYDQSGNGNTLTIEGAGGNGGADAGALATALPVYAGGDKVYGVYVSDGVGYRDNSTTNIATGSNPEGMYMITSGDHVNGGCCFDYGNAETNSDDNGNGHMDSINYSTECWFSCQGSGPWVQADLENGLFAGSNGTYSGNTGINHSFVTAMLKNNGTSAYAIKGGDATTGSLTTFYSGALPTTSGYNPMHKEGAIVLGTGGDDSNSSVGDFFEGVMTSGYPSDTADAAVQANIVSVGYSTYTQSVPASGSTYYLTNVNSGLRQEPSSCSTSNGAGMVLASVAATTCEQWTINKVTSGTSNKYDLINVASGKALDVYNCVSTNNATLDQWTLYTNDCQKFNIISTGTAYVIVNAVLGRTADVTNCYTSAGTVVREWQWLDNTCQEWTLTAA